MCVCVCVCVCVCLSLVRGGCCSSAPSFWSFLVVSRRGGRLWPSPDKMRCGSTAREARTATDAVTRESPHFIPCGGLASPQGSRFAQSSAREGKKRRVGRFASWNVRSLVEHDGGVERARLDGSVDVVEDRKIELVVRLFKRYDIEAAGLQETKWFGNSIYPVSDATVLSSGRPVPPQKSDVS